MDQEAEYLQILFNRMAKGELFEDEIDEFFLRAGKRPDLYEIIDYRISPSEVFDRFEDE